MGIAELLLIAAGLSMDAFAVAVGKGLSAKQCGTRHAVIAGAYFGIFQAVMPLIGYFFGEQFEEQITSFDHWVVFGLLSVIGANMIRESFSKEERSGNGSFGFKVMIVMALATSIDALAVGVTFALLPQVIPVAASVIIIGIITFLLSYVGVKIGAALGPRLKRGAEIAGGAILILIGVKILLEHLGVIHF
jgi:putative Mn2+ efflux pump MntP